MGRIYTIKHDAIAVTTAITIMQLKCGPNSICKIHRLALSQSSSTTSAQVRIQILRKSAAATVTAFSPLLVDAGDGAAKSVGGVAATGITATVEGTNTDILITDTFNVLSGYLYLPVPEERIIVGGAGIIGITFPAAYSYTWTGELVFEEIGG